MFEDAKPNKRPVGRPRKDLTDKEWEMFLSMMRISCTQVECCSVLGMDEDTLERNIAERGEVNFSELYKKYSGQGKTSLRRLQYSSAESGNVTMQIWLGKQWLGQTDNIKTTHDFENAPLVELVVTKPVADGLSSLEALQNGTD
jgi:hypothetical protein